MAIVRVWTNPGQDEWLVNTETRKVAPAECGRVPGDSRPLCLDDFREPGKIAVSAFDEEGREWLLDLETFRAMPAIAGGDDSLVPPETCPIHRSAELRHSDVSLEESVWLLGVRHISYCPLLECDYVTCYVGGLTKIRDRILLLVAVRQKAFFKKFAEQFVGNGK